MAREFMRDFVSHVTVIREEGDVDHLVPKIAGQHYEYLRRQMYDAVDGRRPGFPEVHIKLLARLEHEDIAGVADYLSRIGVRYAGTPPIPVSEH